jgi:hypothetical protein
MVRAALEAGEAAWRRSHRGTGVADAIAAFLRALPTGNGYSPHDLAAAVDAAATVTKEPSNGTQISLIGVSDLSDSRDEVAALRADNAYMGYVVHGPLLPEQEARATKIERDALRAENERLRLALNEIGYDINPAFARERARAALAAKENPDG